MSILIACGNSICGNSAIAAVAPVIGADGDDIASSISFTAVLGVIVVLTLPLLVPVLQLSLTQYGVLAGLTVYAVPQVLAATLPIGALSQPGRHRDQAGARVDARAGGARLFAVRRRLARRIRQGPRQSQRPRFDELVPWFIVGFLVVLAARSLGLIPQALLPRVTGTAALLTTVAMAALGLGVDVRVVAQTGMRVTLAVTASLDRARPDELRADQGSTASAGRSPDVTSVQSELAVDGADFRRLDQPRMRHRHRVQRTLELFQPEIEEFVEHWKVRAEIVVLPDIGL